MLVDEQLFLTVKETAARFRRTPKTIHSWIRNGIIAAACPGGQYLISSAEINRLLRQKRAERESQ